MTKNKNHKYFIEHLNEISNYINPISEQFKSTVEGGDRDLRRAVDLAQELVATASNMDEQLTILQRQARSIRLTGFADWKLHEEKELEKSVPVPSTPTNKAKTSKVSFPEFVYPPNDKPTYTIKVASILDTFSESAFSYEWENVPLTRKNWRTEIEGCSLLFVESAWAGNNNDWRYCLTGTSAPRPEVVELVNYAKSNKIPTVFWNKEDPPHFSDFLRTAALFDVVLTTDANCVEEYIAQLGHSRVGILPFAAQPNIHNPMRPHKVHRSKSVAFGGMYFAHKYPERKKQMEYLLPAASKYDLEIYSRQLGGDPNYQFPAPFDKSVVGSLGYDQMLSAYHAYKVFLNVNSVTTSSTMCARRIFEIIASGGSVVSAPSPAIEAFFPDGLVPMPGNEKEAAQEIRTLLQPGGYREKEVLKAQRIIWSQHTFGHRVDRIFEWANLPTKDRKVTVSVIAPTMRPDYVENILASVGRQVNVELELNLLLHGFTANETEIRSRARSYGIQKINILHATVDHSLGQILNKLVAASSGDVVSKMDDDDYYGAHYLEDLLNAKMFSKAEVVGKGSTYIHFESKNATILSYAASENRYTEFVRGATLTADRELFLQIPFQDLGKGEDSTFLKNVVAGGGKIYASDRFNFWVRRSSDARHHTWTVEDRELFSTGPVVSFGNPSEFVEA